MPRHNPYFDSSSHSSGPVISPESTAKEQMLRAYDASLSYIPKISRYHATLLARLNADFNADPYLGSYDPTLIRNPGTDLGRLAIDLRTIGFKIEAIVQGSCYKIIPDDLLAYHAMPSLRIDLNLKKYNQTCDSYIKNRRAYIEGQFRAHLDEYRPFVGSGQVPNIEPFSFECDLDDKWLIDSINDDIKQHGYECHWSDNGVVGRMNVQSIEN